MVCHAGFGWDQIFKEIMVIIVIIVDHNSHNSNNECPSEAFGRFYAYGFSLLYLSLGIRVLR